MAELTPIPFATQVADGRAVSATAELVENLYLERNPEGAKSPVALLGTPGLKFLTNFGTGKIRGILRMRNSLWVVTGNSLYHLTAGLTQTLVGPINGTGPVHMEHNGTHVVIATGDEFYAANLAAGVLQLPISGVNGLAYQDGYLIASRAGDGDTGVPGEFYISGLDDATTWSALDFSTADAFPDFLIGCISDHRELWLFGQTSTEVWVNTGNALFPFERTGGGFMERGCAAEFSIAKMANSVFWLGDDFQVYMAAQYQPIPISTHAVNKRLKEDSGAGNARAFTYSQEGHYFYVLTTANNTLVYDLTSQRWHVRKSRLKDRWLAEGYAFIWGKHIVGDYQTGNLYEVDLDHYDDNGEEIVRRAILPPLHGGGNRLIIDELFLDMDVGVGKNYLQTYDAWAASTAYSVGDKVRNNSNLYRCETAGTSAGSGGPTSTLESITDNTVKWRYLRSDDQGSDPKVLLRSSDDGGRTWSGDRERSIGLKGEWETRVAWYRLGSSYQRTFQFAISDPVKVALLQAYARVERLAA